MDTAAFLGCFQHVVSHEHAEKKKGAKGGGGREVEESESKRRKEDGNQGGDEDDLKMKLQLKDGLSDELLLQLGKLKEMQDNQVGGGGEGRMGKRKGINQSSSEEDDLKMNLQLKDGLSDDLLLQLSVRMK